MFNLFALASVVFGVDDASEALSAAVVADSKGVSAGVVGSTGVLNASTADSKAVINSTGITSTILSTPVVGGYIVKDIQDVMLH